MDLEQICGAGHHQPDVTASVAESNALMGTASCLGWMYCSVTLGVGLLAAVQRPSIVLLGSCVWLVLGLSV